MKKALLIVLALALASVSAFAVPCATSTNVLSLNAMGAGVTCTYQGLVFSNFFFSGYNDLNSANGNNYFLSGISNTYFNPNPVDPNTAHWNNYLVGFTGTAATGITVTVSPNVPAAGQWLVTSPFGNSVSSLFNFELRYTVAPDVGNPNIQNIAASMNNVVYSSNEAPPPATTQASFTKTALAPQGGNLGSTTDLLIAASGSQTNVFTPLPSASGYQIVDNPSINITYIGSPTVSGSTSLALGSIGNTFNFVPEPMTFGLMGAGLVGLALLRRRAAKK
jgi:hypothetical protein